MSARNPQNPWLLAGIPRADSEVQSFIDALRLEPKRDEFGGLSIELFSEAGFCIYTGESGLVSSVFLYAEGTDECAGYKGALPFDLTFSAGRGDVLARVWQPDRTGPDWDRFQLGTRYIQFQYADGGSRTRLITAYPWTR
jgi:hypothetical protein